MQFGWFFQCISPRLSLVYQFAAGNTKAHMKCHIIFEVKFQAMYDCRVIFRTIYFYTFLAYNLGQVMREVYAKYG